MNQESIAHLVVRDAVRAALWTALQPIEDMLEEWQERKAQASGFEAYQIDCCIHDLKTQIRLLKKSFNMRPHL